MTSASSQRKSGCFARARLPRFFRAGETAGCRACHARARRRIAGSRGYTGGETSKRFILLTTSRRSVLANRTHRIARTPRDRPRRARRSVPSNRSFRTNRNSLNAIRVSSEIMGIERFHLDGKRLRRRFLALMDEGVPIKKPVAGISVGLVTEFNGEVLSRYTTLLDIIGSEDYFGDNGFQTLRHRHRRHRLPA